MDDKYIVAPNRCISTKVGLKKPGDKITERECGKNWNTLIKKGWILKQEELKFKNEVEESKMQIAKPEKNKEKKKEIKIKKVKDKKIDIEKNKEEKKDIFEFGAKKKEENNSDKENNNQDIK